MHFDDRLATVLRHRASGDRAARTQFRQLLDLLGRKPKQTDGNRDESLLAAAWLRLGALGEAIPATERAAMISEPGTRFRNAELAAHLAEDEPEVAAAALSRADLSEDDWNTLVPRLPVRARGFLRLRRDLPPSTQDTLERLGIHDRGLPQPEAEAGSEPKNEPEPQLASGSEPDAPDDVVELDTPRPDLPLVAANDVSAGLRADSESESGEDDTQIGALVRRIEAFRKARNDPGDTHDAPRLPLGEQVHSDHLAVEGFAFTTDARGRLNWAEPAVAPMVIGMNLASTALPSRDGGSVLGSALNYHQPVHDRPIELYGAPLIAGDWVVDADPRFTAVDGRFYGFAGMFRRPYMSDDQKPDDAASSEADRLRQLLHELRTPVNAIQGFSEVIQQQLFGPTPHEYRALAAGIAGDSARMLAGFDELDRLARLETGALDVPPGSCNFAAIVDQQIAQLQGVLKSRTAAFDYSASQPHPITMAEQEAEALAWRILATMAGAIGAGENIQIELAEQNGAARLCCELPASLAAETDIFTASAKPAAGIVSAGMFGAGFSLRLARAEAQASGGDLTRVDDWLLVTLPLLTDSGTETSDAGSENAA